MMSEGRPFDIYISMREDMTEREFCSSMAQTKIERIIHSLTLHASTRHIDALKLVATAELYDSDQRLVESGAGKGQNSLVGALAESLEHFSTFKPSSKDLSMQRCDFITHQGAAQFDGFIKMLPSKGASIEALELSTLDKQKFLFVPRLLLCPKMESNLKQGENEKFLARYSSNSGIAFGCTKAEALLHGTHEVIERHILSLFFMAVCGIGPSIKLYAPSKALLSNALHDNQGALAKAEKLQIVIIKDYFNVYFSIAFPTSGAGDLHLSAVGSGSSLSVLTAVQRAVTEQFQADALYDDSQDECDRKTHDFLASSSVLRPLIDFEPLKNIKLPAYNHTATNFAASVPLQLKTLENNLIAAGTHLYHRTVIQYGEDGIVCQSYVPGLERFNLIRNGSRVAPQRILLQA